MPSGAGLALAAAGLLILVLLATAGLRTTRRRRRPEVEPLPESRARARPWPAVVVNPTKVPDLDAQKDRVAAACAAAGWAPPRWYETTLEDPGLGQAQEALAQGAGTVLAYGGDGTLRTVASAVTGTSVPLGIMPAGTGNLLARNLGIPITDQDACLEIALAGAERSLDVGRAEVDVSGEDERPVRHTFLVMAGIGFDAEVMAAVEPKLKERIGWWAYVVAGVQQLRGSSARVVVRLDAERPVSRRVRTVVIGNCGELTGGVALMPEARPDDGWLDVVIVAPRGVGGWASVVLAVTTRSRRGHPMVQHLRCRRVEIRAERPLLVEMDGDPVGSARVLRAGVDEGALVVRVPSAS